MTSLPTPYAAARIAAFLDDHLSWSAYWDKHYGLWRVAEDDPGSDLYAESRDAERCPVRAFKEISGEPKSRYHV